jgi:hypothetical protein
MDRLTVGTIATERGVHHDTIEHALETSLQLVRRFVRVAARPV